MIESSRESYNASRQAAMAIGSVSSVNQEQLRFQLTANQQQSNQNDEEDDDEEDVIDLSDYEENRSPVVGASNRPIKSDSLLTRRPPMTTSTLNRAGASVSTDLSGRGRRDNQRVRVSGDEPDERRRVVSKSDAGPVIVYSLAGLSMIAGIVIVVVYLSNQTAKIDANSIASTGTGDSSQANPQMSVASFLDKQAKVLAGDDVKTGDAPQANSLSVGDTSEIVRANQAMENFMKGGGSRANRQSPAMNPGGQANDGDGADAMFRVPPFPPRNAAPAPAEPPKTLIDQYRDFMNGLVSTYDSMCQTLKGVVDEKSAEDANEHLAKLLDEQRKLAEVAERLPDLGFLDDLRFTREIKPKLAQSSNSLLPELRRIRNNPQLNDAIIIDCDVLIEALMEFRKKLGIR